MKYRINGKEISEIPKLSFKEASLMQEHIIIQQFNFLLEALSDKEEEKKCLRCQRDDLGQFLGAGPEHICGKDKLKQEEYYDHSNTKIWLVKENGNVEKFEEPKQEECENDCVRRYPSSKDWCDKHKKSTSLKEKTKLCNDALPEIIKQAEYPIRHWTLGNFDEANKQSTSLKEVPLKDKIDFIQDRLLNDHITTEQSITEILEVVQSHLLKEIDRYDKEVRGGTGRIDANDIIKIINNLTN